MESLPVSQNPDTKSRLRTGHQQQLLLYANVSVKPSTLCAYVNPKKKKNKQSLSFLFILLRLKDTVFRYSNVHHLLRDVYSSHELLLAELIQLARLLHLTLNSSTHMPNKKKKKKNLVQVFFVFALNWTGWIIFYELFHPSRHLWTLMNKYCITSTQ